MKFLPYCPRHDRDRIEAVWSDLFRSDRHPYFLSWGWIETWLDVIPAGSKVVMWVALANDRPAIAFFLGGPRWRWRTFLPARTITLNATGREDIDRICIEYNCILHDEGAPPDLARLLTALPIHWDRLVLPDLDARRFPANGFTEKKTSYRVTLDRGARSYFVDLLGIRSTGASYLSCLTANTRYQLRKANRHYEQIGALETHLATTLQQALDLYEEMIELNIRTWQKRDQKSAFESPFFRHFHRELISRRFPHGEIQLLKLTCGGDAIGVLYNLCMARKVFFYQCGFRYEGDRNAKPGLVTHLAAIEHNLNEGYECYDFLAGDARYKRSLASDFNLVRRIELENTAGFSGILNEFNARAQTLIAPLMSAKLRRSVIKSPAP
jgi:CelD/BcsL family acetyltransferase involved in cellulose biosynthesis